MDRIYKNYSDDKKTHYFVGKEIEHTKFYNMTTLFVVGNRPTDEIISKILEWDEKHSKSQVIEHIYLTANHSWKEFTYFHIIEALIDAGYKVTYEIPARELEDNHTFYKGKLPLSNPDFCLMLSVVMPEINSFLSAAVIKLDDADVNRKNPGVWCIDAKAIATEERFTDWSEYGNDEIF